MTSSTKAGDQKSEITRKRIVAGLEACIVKFGYAQTKWVDIAEAADLSTPHLRYYFKNKESILEHQYEHLVQQFERAVSALPQSLGPDWFTELAHLIFDTKRRSRESVMILMQANIVTAHSAPLQALKRRYDQQIQAAIEAQLDYLDIADARSVAEIIFHLLSGLMLNTAFESKRKKEQAIELFLQFVHTTTKLDV